MLSSAAVFVWSQSATECITGNGSYSYSSFRHIPTLLKYVGVEYVSVLETS